MGIDHKQQIYEGGSGEAEILTALGLRRRNAALLDTYRCSPYVVDAAACLPNPEEAEQLRMGTRTAGEKETPVLDIADDFEDERSRLIDMIRTRQSKGERVAILLPQKRQVYGRTPRRVWRRAASRSNARSNGAMRTVTEHSTSTATYRSC